MKIESKGDRIIFHTQYHDKDNKPIDVSIKQYGEFRGRIKEWLGNHFTRFFLPENYGVVSKYMYVDGLHKKVYLDKTSIIKQIVDLGVPLDKKSGVIEKLIRSKDAADMIFNNIPDFRAPKHLDKLIDTLAQQKQDGILAGEKLEEKKREDIFSDVNAANNQLNLNLLLGLVKIGKEKNNAWVSRNRFKREEKAEKILNSIFRIDTTQNLKSSPYIIYSDQPSGIHIYIRNCTFEKVSGEDFNKLIAFLKEKKIAKLTFENTPISGEREKIIREAVSVKNEKVRIIIKNNGE